MEEGDERGPRDEVVGRCTNAHTSMYPGVMFGNHRGMGVFHRVWFERAVARFLHAFEQSVLHADRFTRFCMREYLMNVLCRVYVSL